MTGARPLILGPGSFALLDEPGHTLGVALVEACGCALNDTFRIVVGMRSVWFWLYERSPEGHPFLDEETGDVAYRVERFDLGIGVAGA